MNDMFLLHSTDRNPGDLWLWTWNFQMHRQSLRVKSSRI